MVNNNTHQENQAYNHYLALSKPTEEDFQRIFTDDELKELCLKHKSRVDMWRWNVVNDYRTLFTKSGRYHRWSDRRRMLMLAKAVNKMKPTVLYDEEEIKRIRQEEWGLQLKENILSLNYWKRKQLNELQDPMLYVTDSEETNSELLQNCDVNTESMNVADIFTQSQATAPLEEPAKSLVPVTEKPPTAALCTQSVKSKVLVDIVQDECVIDEDTDDSNDTILFTPYRPRPSVNIIMEPAERLQSEEVAPEIENIYGVNTMSMTIDSQLSAQSSLDVPLAQSEDVVPHNYDNFKNIIPLTSTQSQNHESEEMRVV